MKPMMDLFGDKAEMKSNLLFLDTVNQSVSCCAVTGREGVYGHI